MLNVISPAAELIDGLRIVLILRHPAEVIASRLTVQDRKGTTRTFPRHIEEHNKMLGRVVQQWARLNPMVVTYPMIAEPGLHQLKAITGLDQMDANRVWHEGKKRYPEDGQTDWTTPLFGKPVACNTSGRKKLSVEELSMVEEQCLPICHQILQSAGLSVDDYWQPVAQS